MRRFSFLLLLLLGAQVRAEPLPTVGQGWNPKLATEVYAVALSFMAPRILEPVPVPQLALWGLRGLTALDPDMAVEQQNGQLRLLLANRVLASRPIPEGDQPRGWAEAASAFATAAWNASAAIRKAGPDGVVQGFFDELFNHLDPYSRYVPPRAAAEDRARRSGRAGAGLTLVNQGGAVVIQEAIPDGPGALVGLRVGDRILSVDGRSTRGQSAAAVSDWIAGPEDTIVEVQARGRDGRPRDLEVRRAMVPPETVFSERLNTVLILRITGFNRRTDARLARELASFMAEPHPPTGIIIDLRGNRGGLVREAVAVAGELLPAGIVATTAGRDPDASRIWRSVNNQLVPEIPVVVVVDGRSASAAEILAAALADRGRAVILGSVTQGKGQVQTITPLPDGGELFVTWSRVLAPLGWPIQGLGVMPQVCTSLGQGNLERQLASLAAGVQSLEPTLIRHRDMRAPFPSAQALAIRGLCPAAEGRDSDLATARYLIDHPASYVTALLPAYTGD